MFQLFKGIEQAVFVSCKTKIFDQGEHSCIFLKAECKVTVRSQSIGAILLFNGAISSFVINKSTLIHIRTEEAACIYKKNSQRITIKAFQYIHLTCKLVLLAKFSLFSEFSKD